MITHFLIYGLLGWNVEVIWTGLASLLRGNINLIGHTSVWMFFVYGGACVAFEAVYKQIKDCNFFVRGSVWAVLIFAVELFCGAILQLLGIEAWYYSGPYALWGLIRLDYAIPWFGAGLLFERVCVLLGKISQSALSKEREPPLQ